MPTLNYLTVQDILWINLQVTKKVQHFNFARLEEATFYQYAYGESNSLISQSGRFITGFAKMHPLDAGNEATAFISFVAFLRMNGKTVNLAAADALTWFKSLGKSPAKEIENAVVDIPDYHAPLQPDVKAIIRGVLEDFATTIEGLSTVVRA